MPEQKLREGEAAAGRGAHIELGPRRLREGWASAIYEPLSI